MRSRTRLIVVGSGQQPYHEYALASLLEHGEVVLVDDDYPSWQSRYVDIHRVARTTDAARLFYSVADLRGEVPDAAVITWHGPSVVAVAEVATKLGMRSMSPDAARTCARPIVAYEALASAGLLSMRYATAKTRSEVLRLAPAVGFPLVLTSAGRRSERSAVLAWDAGELREAALNVSTRPGSAALEDDYLVEEYIDGPAFDVHSVVLDGHTEVLAVTRMLPQEGQPLTASGYAVEHWQHESWADRLRSDVADAHAAVGADWGVTNVRVRIGADGPRVIGIRPWLANDLIPVLIKAATGVDLVAVAASIAMEQNPRLDITCNRFAAVRFLSTTRSGTIQQVTLPDVAAVPGLTAGLALVNRGDTVAPVGSTTRVAALLAVGDSGSAVRDVLTRAEAASHVEID